MWPTRQTGKRSIRDAKRGVSAEPNASKPRCMRIAAKRELSALSLIACVFFREQDIEHCAERLCSFLWKRQQISHSDFCEVLLFCIPNHPIIHWVKEGFNPHMRLSFLLVVNVGAQRSVQEGDSLAQCTFSTLLARRPQSSVGGVFLSLKGRIGAGGIERSAIFVRPWS